MFSPFKLKYILRMSKKNAEDEKMKFV